LFTEDTGGADSISLGLVSVDIDIASAFLIDYADKFSDDAVLSLDDAGSAGSAGYALVVPLTLASSSGFFSIFFVGLANMAIWPNFCFASFLDLDNLCGQNCICKDY
jgi:hypothetical protein